MSENKLAIAVSGGLVTQVYSTLHPNELDVELLEFDAANRLSEEAAARLARRFADVERTYRKLSIDVNIGLGDAESQGAAPRTFESQGAGENSCRAAGWD